MWPLPSVVDLASRRLALARSSRDPSGTERVLAGVRVVLAVGSLLLVWIDPSEVAPFGQQILWLVIIYLAHSIGLLITVYRRAEVSARFSVVAQTADILWPAVISLFAGGASSPFFLYFIFALLAAGFRWGMRETFITSVAIVIALCVDAVVLERTSLGEIVGRNFDLARFALRIAYLTIFGYLIGYIAESEKRRASEALGISQISAKVRVEVGLKGTVQSVFEEILRLFGARELLIISREAEAARVTLWRAEIIKSGKVVFTWRQLDDAEERQYLCAMEGESAGATWRNNKTESSITLNKDGVPRPGQRCYLESRFVKEHRFKTLLVCALAVAPEVSAQILLFDPTLGGRAETQLRFLQDLAHLLAPAVYNVYLLRRLRSRAAAVERARVARELHDGVVQSLHAIAFRLYAMRTRPAVSAGEQEQELLEIQQLVQNEAVNLRALIQQLEPLDFDPRHLVDYLSGIVTRYRQDTGIGAQFVCDVPDVSLPPAICREIAGITREALANVRRHSRARNVLVRLSHERAAWMLSIEDDGRGFEFSGHFTNAELEDFGRGPLVIRQRVRAIEGELTITSKAGQGARLEIKVPDYARANTA